MLRGSDVIDSVGGGGALGLALSVVGGAIGICLLVALITFCITRGMTTGVIEAGPMAGHPESQDQTFNDCAEFTSEQNALSGSEQWDTIMDQEIE
jgi:hypothetical protein